MNRKIQCLFDNKRILMIAVMNILLVITVLRFFLPLYEENDDFGMGCIASGIYGTEYMQYLIYSNIVYGYFLKILGLAFEGVNWYVVMQYLLLTAAVISIFYSFSVRIPFHIAVCANLLFWYAGFFDQIRRIQFTRTASVLSIAGFLLIWSGCTFVGRKQTVFGMILCIAGSCIRLDCFWPCMAFFGILFLVLCFSPSGFRKELFRKYLVVLLMLVGIVGTLNAVDSICYAGNEEWACYKEYNAVRAALLDYGIPDWEANKERYEGIGFTENDLKIMGEWILADPEKFSYEHLGEIASWKEWQGIRLSEIGLFLKAFLAEKHAVLLFDLWAVLLMAGMLKNNMCRVFAMFNAGLVFGEAFCLYYIGRVLPRAEYGIILSAIFSMAVCIVNSYVDKDPDKLLEKKWIAGALIFYLLFLGNDYVVCYKDYCTAEADKSWEAQGRLAERLSEDTDRVYVLNTMTFLWICLYFKPYEKPPEYYLSNFTYTGGWYSNSPFDKAHNDRLGLENPMKDLLYKDNVYYVKAAVDGIDAELLFMQENYKQDVLVRIVDSIDGCNVYQFY